MRVTQAFEGTYSASAVPFFRGHSSPTYQLLPGLLRPTPAGMYIDYDEKNFYYEFRARAGALLRAYPSRLVEWYAVGKNSLLQLTLSTLSGRNLVKTADSFSKQA
jgi:hypothetical protein